MHTLIPAIANPLTARMHKGINTTCDEGQTMIAHSLRADGFEASEDEIAVGFYANGGAQGGSAFEHVAPTSKTGGLTCVAFDARQSDVIQYGEKTGPLDTDGRHTMGIQAGMAVRRLTPRECERLQGFPDDYTLTPYRGKPAADGPRYKALGNSMAVPVMHWIGKRIQQVQDISKKELA